MNQIPPIEVPPIEMAVPAFWDSLESRYRAAFVISEGKLKLTEAYFFICHTIDKSTMVHSIAAHLEQRQKEYAKRYDYTYRLLKSAFLESLFGLREALACLVDAVFNLEQENKTGSTSNIYKRAVAKKLAVAKCLKELIPPSSKLGRYLKDFRHPYVHWEDLSRTTGHDMLAAIIGHEQLRIANFIATAKEISEWILAVESQIAEECAKHLGFH